MTTTAANLEAPAITLKNGLRVANFSSPHEFNFEDGGVLPPCTKERSAALNLARNDREVPWGGPRSPGWPTEEQILAVTPGFATTPEIVAELEELEGHWDVDIILVPFPVLQSLRDEKMLEKFKKVATVITTDRITKAASTTKFGGSGKAAEATASQSATNAKRARFLFAIRYALNIFLFQGI